MGCERGETLGVTGREWSIAVTWQAVWCEVWGAVDGQWSMIVGGLVLVDYA